MRQYGIGDAGSILDLVGQNRECLAREFSRQGAMDGLRDAESFVTQKAAVWSAGKTFCYGIWQKETNQLAGQIQVKNVDWEIPVAELGYFIGRASQRQGYASEAIKGILELAFKKLSFQRVFVRILPTNQVSLALARKLGFQKEGVHRNAFRCGFGHLHDVHCLAMIAADYRRQQRHQGEPAPTPNVARYGEG